ncbi:MAG: YitT family protein [Oscillospiraceae bacterium]|nr:YitT family protein [Oscillospiraceae bacterium]
MTLRLRNAKDLGKLLRIIAGSFLYALGFQFFLYHNAIPTGGVTGLAMIINYLTRIPVGVLIIVINVPIFLVAWHVLGGRYILGSLIGMVLSSVFVDLLAMTPINVTREPLLACVFAGVIEGFGLGIVYSTGATTGGVDNIAKLLRRRYQHINLSTLILMFDVCIVIVFAIVFKKPDSAMYGIISMFLVSKSVDFVLYGAVTSKLCYIISDESERVKTAIVSQLNRGVTVIHGEGAYSGLPKQVLMCVVKRQQVMALRTIVQASDEKAFMIFTDARDVYGEGFMNLYSTD